MMASLDSENSFSISPNELLECIFQYLTVEDLCRVASCGRAWREAANSDVLWRPLCREKGWERYGTVTDLCKEIPSATASQEQDAGQACDSIVFPNDLIVNRSAWPGLVDTCKWKEVYMKARHLEANWCNNRYSIVSFEFGSGVYDLHADRRIVLCNLDGEGKSLVGGVSNGTVRIWDVTDGHCRHIIKVNVSYERDALKMKNGVISVGCRDGKIRTFSVQTGEQFHVLSGHRLEVSRLFFDGETIVSFAQFQASKSGARQFEDNDVRVWNSADGSSRFVFQSISHGTQVVDLDYLDKTVAVAYDDSTIRLWDVWTDTCKGTITTGVNKIISCHLGDGIIISASMRNDIKTWNLDSGECMKTFDLDKDGPHLWSCIFNGELLAVHLAYFDLRIFNKHGKHVGSTNMFNMEPICIHGNKLVTAMEFGGANHLWLIDRCDGCTLVNELRRPMDSNKFTEVLLHDTMVWMSDTKLAFVQYYDAEDRGTNPEQIPKIFVYHYW